MEHPQTEGVAAAILSKNSRTLIAIKLRDAAARRIY